MKAVPFALRTLPPPTTQNGRPTSLTTEIARIICVAIFAGSYQEVAARYAGVHPTQLSKWMHASGEPYETFQKWVHEAQAGGEIRAVQAITSGMLEDPHLAIAFLERKHPERWAKVVANPAAPLNINLNLTTMLTQIEERAAAARDPRKPIPGKITIIDAMRGDERPRREPIPLAAHVEDADDASENAREHDE